MKFKYEYCMDKNLVGLFIQAANKYPENIIYKYKKTAQGSFVSITYRDFYEKMKLFAAGMTELELNKKRMFIISDNCIEWVMAVIANMGMGGIDIPRGNGVTRDELEYIINLSAIDFICLQNRESCEKFDNLNFKKNVRRIIFDGTDYVLKDGDMLFDDVCKKGQKYLTANPFFFEEHAGKIKPDDVCTVIFTSGTTGNPKGVMLSHRNLTYAPTESPGLVKAWVGDRWMSILPVWHVGERFFEFMGIIHGVTIILSNPFNMRDDMKNEKPHLIPGVPLVWKRIMKNVVKGIEEAGKGKIFNFFYSKSQIYMKAKRILTGKNPRFVENSLTLLLTSVFKYISTLPFHLFAKSVIYKKISVATGGCIKTITSGGGNLPDDVDDFFEIMGFNMIDGYGSTETGTLVTLRKDNDVKNTIGRIMPRTMFKIINEDTGIECKPGETGLLFVKGEQVFKAYYKNERATLEVLDKDGWFKTGDLVKKTITSHLLFVGRLKDTIVLLNGENVEPEPLEEIIEDCDLIAHAVVFGQDREALSAMIVPDFDALKKHARGLGLDVVLSDDKIAGLFKAEVKKRISTVKGFHQNQLIRDVILLDTEFKVGVELTNTMKKKRNVILEKYKNSLDI